ncbi:chaperone protein YajL [bacterium BMS3Bbin11]|nr:chaperone protein YajL [bacterium BMS3Abin11]GBE46510.1 chaperone protein YajL [bacterium BMS3Bbin11]GMT40188.1 MAG: 4-methyl-5(B-hydroxyethyl)-thiazole monophosphate biosynthesis protein [bacterium]HDH08234.1 DJ-1/PfpI family protein [Gammaproteobacteria bacterium]HDH15890.1 DJ-1/PfpI family protein [Gammaproteobacteria bacterium]
MKKVLVPLAAGFEELEAVTIIDLLRRANISVTVAGLADGAITGSRGTRILPDEILDTSSASDYDMIVLPGGLPGADNLNNDSRIHDLLKQMANDGRYIAAICAAPKVLATAGLLKNKEVTSFPGALSDVATEGMHHTGMNTVIDGNVITSRGPGTAMDFSLELIQLLAGTGTRQKVEQGLQR